MGDIAEGILNGDFDELTGEYLGEGMGFPRSMYHDKKPNAIFGIKNYLKRKIDKNHINEFVITYCIKELKFSNSFDKCCPEIQKDFTRFVQYTNNYLNSLIIK